MMRFLLLLFLISLSGVVSAQVADTARARTMNPGTLSPVTSVADETRAQEEAFAAWKVRYATNRAKVVQDIKAVQQELTTLSPAKADLKQQLTDLLNGTVRRWNEEKTDFGDPDQFSDCQDLFTTIRRAMRDGILKL